MKLILFCQQIVVCQSPWHLQLLVEVFNSSDNSSLKNFDHFSEHNSFSYKMPEGYVAWTAGFKSHHRLQIKVFFYWAGHFLSPLFLPFFQLFLSECACVLRIIMCFRFQVQLQLLDLFSRTLHYNSEFLAFVTRGRRPCQCLSEDTPAYQEVKGYSLETLPVLREMLRLKICVCWCVFHRESRSKGRERPMIIVFNADNISSWIFWGPFYFLFVSLCSKERLGFFPVHSNKL